MHYQSHPATNAGAGSTASSATDLVMNLKRQDFVEIEQIEVPNLFFRQSSANMKLCVGFLRVGVHATMGR